MYKLYKRFFDAYCPVYESNRKKDKLHGDANREWNSLKNAHKNSTNDALIAAVNLRIAELEAKDKSKKVGLAKFWSSSATKKKPAVAGSSTTSVTASSSTTTSQNEDCIPIPIPSPVLSLDDSGISAGNQPPIDNLATISPKKKETPAQMTLTKKLDRVNAKIAGYKMIGQNSQVKPLLKEKSALELKLRTLKRNAVSQQNARARKKQKMSQIMTKFPDVAAELSSIEKQSVGRPLLDTQYPALNQTILEIVNAQSSTDERRRTEALRACHSLDQLLAELKKRDIHISRTALYLRLIPRNASTIEGKRHYKCLPVKLIRAQHDQRAQHNDSHFAMGTIKMLKDLAVLFGNESVLFLSVDDKARIPLGLPAANKQAPLLMNLMYRVRLPDHDWVKATNHKLIPSVTAACVIDDKEVTYVGPTFASIRSAKHDSSTASSHAADFDFMLKLKEFECVSHFNGKLKPILIVLVDGGPDENPRFPKTLAAWARHFQKYEFDAVFVATHAPGQSAYNPVERRMAPLSHDLSGLILPHDGCGSHLDCNGHTVDTELELLNFQKAGTILAELWSDTVIGKYQVVAEYCDPGSTKPNLVLPPEAWLAKHVRQSQYLLQIVKCDGNCCSEWKTNYSALFPNRFLPPPLPVCRMDDGLRVSTEIGRYGSLTEEILYRSIEPQTMFQIFPFDYFCPSIANQNILVKRICTNCGIYFPSQARMKSHFQELHTRQQAIDNSDSDLEDNGSHASASENDENMLSDNETVVVPSGDAPIRSVFEWLRTEYEIDDS